MLTTPFVYQMRAPLHAASYGVSGRLFNLRDAIREGALKLRAPVI
jgi:hypothetical protein